MRTDLLDPVISNAASAPAQNGNHLFDVLPWVDAPLFVTLSVLVAMALCLSLPGGPR